MKENNRSLSELYKIALKEYTKQGRATFTGLCVLISSLKREEIISLSEWDRLYKDFISNKPNISKWPDFYNHPLYRKLSSVTYLTYWWFSDKKNYEHLQQRELFLKTLIKHHEEQEIK